MKQGPQMSPPGPQTPQGPASPQQPKYLHWRMLIWLVVLALAGMYFASYSRQPQVAELTYTEFKQKVRQDKVASLTMEEQKIRGEFSEPQKVGEEKDAPKLERFATVRPPVEDPALMELLEEHDVKISAEPGGRSWWMSLLVGVLPWLLIIGFFVWTSKKMRERMGGGAGGPGGIFGFGKSKAKLFTKSISEVTFQDVAGLDNAKKELEEVIGFLRDPGKYRELGAELPRGILLVGPPGNGKTLLARAAAGEADVPVYIISGSEFIEMFVGVGASRVRDMFNKAKKEAPAIIFVDELDAIGRVRGTGLGGGHDEREQTLNQILNEMDGIEPQESVVVMAATNRPDVLDPALLRPGRFDRKITIERPQKEARRKILEVHTKETPLAGDVDLEQVARQTVGFSGADLKNLVNEARLLAGRRDKKQVENADFGDARDKILMGVEREEMVVERERRLIAFHEAGHALMARLLPGADPLQKVTIIPRGRALGATEQAPEEDRHNLSKSYLHNRLAVMLGGRAAVQLVFEDQTSGAGDDLKQATQLARKMITQWGMSDKLGPVTYNLGEEHPFLGRQLAGPKDFSDATARLIDEEIRSLVSRTEERALELLERNRDDLETLARELLERETLEAEEINQLLGPPPGGEEQGSGKGGDEGSGGQEEGQEARAG